MIKLILGPCAIESRDHATMMCEKLKEITSDFEVDFYYKSSYDKANRTSGASARGVGIEEGADILQELRETFHVKTLTDVHETIHCERLKSSVDVLQIPAFLCRQTDLLLAAAQAVHSINIKKGQFLAPWDMKNVVEKIPDNDVWITERGSCFGYNTLVVDFRGLVSMREFKCPIIFDATHSVQQPGGKGTSSGGQREFIVPLARAAAAVGVDGIFMEVHDNPELAISDSATQLPLNALKSVLSSIMNINNDQLLRTDYFH
jgi:2-dehydro-3-deoxyphosphooctonate aldolase (KDO 8-P synthase)